MISLKLLTYINTHPNWRHELQEPPYSLNIITQDDYFLFHYSKASDFSYDIVQEANGIIIRYDTIKKEYFCLNYPYTKIFEYGSKFAPKDFDIESATVRQELDGMLVFCWYDEGYWHFSSTTEIDLLATDIMTDILQACNGDMKQAEQALHPSYCYTFMLTSPSLNRIIDYGAPKLWYLGRTNILTGKEDLQLIVSDCFAIPHLFQYLNNVKILTSLKETMSKNEAGFILIDKNYNKIKFESNEYLLAKYFSNIGQPSIKMFIKIWQDDKLDAYINLFKTDETAVKVRNAINSFVNALENNYQQYSNKYRNRDIFLKHLPKFSPCESRYYTMRYDGTVIPNAELFVKDACTADELQGEVSRYMFKNTLAKVTQ